jgi:CRISPR-associated protein Cas1
MPFRNIFIRSKAYISIKNKQLIISTDEQYSFPIEDISSVMVESNESVITSAVLSQLGQSGCLVYFCDDSHLPCASLMSYCQHSRTTQVVNSQLLAKEPQKKKTWQKIVVSKIQNQAKCLDLFGQKEASNILIDYSKRVKSGDIDNIEATAAQFYFPNLFGRGFKRSSENKYNSSLNYGYSILRGCVARSIVNYGLLASIGVHHKSALNAFNLADDFIEPFRPVVDMIVMDYFKKNIDEEDIPKGLLYDSLNIEVELGQARQSVSYAAELMVQSYINSLKSLKVDMCLPQLLCLKKTYI